MNTFRNKIIDRRIPRNILLQFQKLATTASVNSSSEIQVPIRKERGPTDILEALETTISRDPTAADYKFIDDPFLIPTSLSKKRMYSLARESGKKAAMWILQEHADLLKSDLSQPLVQAFLPVNQYKTKEQVSEQILNDLIKQARIADVLHVYQLLEGEVTKETKQAILEMLCFYNSNTELIPEELPEERSYQPEAEVFKNTWNNNPEVEKLFGELKADKATAAAAYNALICGTAKYYKVDRAWQLYNECLDTNIPLAIHSYNSMLHLVPLLKDNNEDRKIMIQTILQNMVKNGIKPNIGTLNAALKSASLLQTQGIAKDLTQSLLAEFKSIGVEPCLASYYYVLLTFCRENGSVSNVLPEILDELEKREELIMQDPADKNFFVQAMEVASKHLHDLAVGDRLHKLLLTKKNYKFIGGRLKESVYYRNYLQLILTSETIDEFMKVYNFLVPHIYIPEPAVMRDIIEMLELNESEKAIEILPQFLSQIVQFDMLDRHQIMKLTFKLMTRHCTPPLGSPLHQQYANMAWTLWTHIQEVNQKRMQRTMWPASIYGDVAVLLIRGNEFEKMLEVLNFLVKSLDAVVGSIYPNRLQEIFAACLDRGHVPGALLTVEYACEFGMVDAELMAKTIDKQLPLSPAQKHQLLSLVGSKTFESKATSEQ
ncbi:protein PTCD3 homolog, mitochondrial [Nasonia vitripennis]|uniref:Small ribosomal subunit protein mS39 n=1 Tax=Nasonia vitripennis TaxID=7425 RepID=A0A7M7LMC5_NASVI|nr:protein PTCD3 homolog, mitochondrial [Nasonia vitripennis]